jgi:hypothetical protein
MSQSILKTPVDDLVEIVKKNKEVTIEFLKNQLKIPTNIIENWLVILEEKKILKVTYSGLEGKVKYIDNSINKNKVDITNIKKIFLEKVRNKGYSLDKIQIIWKEFLKTYEEEIKKEFFENAKNRGYSDQKIKKAWELFFKDIQKL